LEFVDSKRIYSYRRSSAEDIFMIFDVGELYRRNASPNHDQNVGVVVDVIVIIIIISSNIITIVFVPTATLNNQLK
jgi:hypothetical protein